VDAGPSVASGGMPVDKTPIHVPVQDAAVYTIAPAPIDASLQLQQAQDELRSKDALIERLSKHLGNALSRLNESSAVASDSSLAALASERVELEKQNNLLKVKQEELQAQVEELSKKSQLLDLENRQLY